MQLDHQTQGDDVNSRKAQFTRLIKHLDYCRQQQQTITYIDLADTIGIKAPQRIHQLTELLEALMEHDQAHSQTQRAALVLSRSGTRLPADGFFSKAKALGLMPTGTAEQFHQQCLKKLFDGSAPTSA
jgi:hypothetical protein